MRWRALRYGVWCLVSRLKLVLWRGVFLIFLGVVLRGGPKWPWRHSPLPVGQRCVWDGWWIHTLSRRILKISESSNTKANHQLKAPPPQTGTFTECARKCYRKLKHRNQNHMFYRYTFVQWRVSIPQRDVLYTLSYGTCICISYAFYIK